jgi:hypothetical protein
MHPFAEDGNKVGDQGPQYEISGMPIENIIEMVAGLRSQLQMIGNTSICIVR